MEWSLSLPSGPGDRGFDAEEVDRDMEIPRSGTRIASPTGRSALPLLFRA